MVQKITSKKVPIERRKTFFPDLFTPQFFVLGEANLYDTATQLSKDYHGGLWDFVQLSNEGGFAYPYGPKEFNIYVPGNGYQDTLEPETFGIICTLFALSNTCIQAFNLKIRAANEVLADRYHALRDYVAQRPDRRIIMASID